MLCSFRVWRKSRVPGKGAVVLYMEILMASSNLINNKERGRYPVTDEDALAERLAQGPIALYWCFDPTADSLHLGHLAPLLCLKRFQQVANPCQRRRRRDRSDWRPELKAAELQLEH